MLRILIQLLPAIFILTRAAIIDLDDQNFDTDIRKHEIALVVFHAPWCGQCKKLMSRLPDIDRKLQENTPSINIFKVDCETSGRSTCEKYQIGGYPILKSFRKGREYGKFEGSREINDIVKFMKVEAAPVAHKLDDFVNLENILRAEDRVCLVARLQRDTKLEKIFLSLAEKLRAKMSFLYIYTDENIVWIKLFQTPKLWNKFEENFVEYSGLEDITKLEDFIKYKYHGLVGLRTFSNRNEFHFPLVTAYFDVDYAKNLKGTNYWRNRILKVAINYKDKFNFAISSKNEFHDELRDFGIENISQDKPIIIVILESNERFVLKNNFSVETFDRFLHNISHGRLNPYLKSQAPPKKNDSYVVVAVGSTFYDLVINSNNDTMIKLYAEWCGHCKRLHPTYKKLAKMMRNESITFIEVDATENDVPVAYTPTGYPTIYWSTKEYRMNPIRYQGDRSLEDFIRFIAKHATHELNGYDRNGNSKPVKTEL